VKRGRLSKREAKKGFFLCFFAFSKNASHFIFIISPLNKRVEQPLCRIYTSKKELPLDFDKKIYSYNLLCLKKIEVLVGLKPSKK